MDFAKDRAAFVNSKYDYKPVFERKKKTKKLRVSSSIPTKSRIAREIIS